MPEITILESDKSKKNLENLSEEEREFAIMQIAGQVSAVMPSVMPLTTPTNIPDKYWQSFAQMITKNIQRRDAILNMPTMRELVFRSIIGISKTFVENKMPYTLYKGILPSLIATRYIVTPIIEDFTYKLDISKKSAMQNEDILSLYSSSSSRSAKPASSTQSDLKVFSMPSTLGKTLGKNLGKSLEKSVGKSQALPKSAQGGAFRRSKGSQHSSMFGQPKLRRNILETDIKMSIRVRFEYPVCCVTETGVFYVAPTQEEISVIGFALGNMCGRIGNDFMPFLIDLMKTGVIKYEQMAANCIEDVLLQTQSTDLQPVIFSEINPLDNMFLFSDIVQKVDEEMYLILNDLISKYDFSYSLDAHRITNEIATSVTYAAIGNKKLTDKVSQIEKSPEKNKPAIIVETPADVPAGMTADIPQGAIDVIYKATGYKPDVTYYDSFIYTLRGINALDLFHKCLIFGKDSKQVKSAVDTIRENKTNLSFLAAIEKKLTEANYKASVIFSIVKNLFGEPRAAQLRTEAGKSGINGDLVMGFLTPREREYITNELKRRESYLLAISGNKCPHLGAMRRLRGARSDEESTRAYNEVKGFFPKGILGGRGVLNNRGSLSNQASPHKYSGAAVAPKLDQKMIKCEVCKFDLICPHLVEIIELKTHKMPPNQIRATLNKYIDDKPLGENYYCKVCGEFLVTSDVYDNSMTESDARTYSNIADELKTLMWGEIAGIIKYLDISVFINVPKLISSVITGIYDFIFEIEKQLIRSKTNTADDVNNKKKLFIVVYAYAYIIDMIMKSEGAIKFKSFASIDKPKPSDLVQFVKYAVINIINTKNIIINQIANITTDQIVEKIRDAYKNIASLKHKTHDIRADESEIDLQALLLNDPMYQYYYYANMLGSGRARKKSSDLADKLEQIMVGLGSQGDKMDKSAKKSSKLKAKSTSDKKQKKSQQIDKPLFEIAKAPSFVVATGHQDNDVNAFDNIVKQGVKMENLAKIIRGYKKKSFMMVYENIRKRGFSKFIFEKDIISKQITRVNTGSTGQQSVRIPTTQITPDDLEAPKLSREFIEAENAAKKVKICEEFLYNFLRLQTVIGVNSWERSAGFYTADHKRQMRDFARVPIKLGNLFDEQGAPHNFSKFVFGSATSPSASSPDAKSPDVKSPEASTPLEFTSAELGNRAQKTSSIGDLGKLISRKCSVCGVMETEAGDLDESRIISALKNKTTADNFFKFYLNRCPYAGLVSAAVSTPSKVSSENASSKSIASTTHNWVVISNASSNASSNDSECSQCKLLQSVQYNVMLTGKQSKESAAYYEKYREVYLQELAKDIDTRKSEPSPKPAIYKVPAEIVTKLEKWSFNYNVIADLSSQLGFNVNAFMCIGAHEKVEYEDIARGKYVPAVTDNYDDTRFNAIQGYIQLLISTYNNLRYYHSILKPADDLKALIEASPIKKHEISELEHLDEIGTTFSADFKNARRVLRPNTLIEYLLETLAIYISDTAAGYKALQKAKSADPAFTSAVKTLCKNFAVEFVKKMLRHEELKTAYTQINWNVFKVKDNKSIDDIIEGEKYDTNLDDEAGIETLEDKKEEAEEEREDKEDRDDERGDTIDVMKNKFDIDLEPDQDFEDFDNEIGEESDLL